MANNCPICESTASHLDRLIQLLEAALTPPQAAPASRIPVAVASILAGAFGCLGLVMHFAKVKWG